MSVSLQRVRVNIYIYVKKKDCFFKVYNFHLAEGVLVKVKWKILPRDLMFVCCHLLVEFFCLTCIFSISKERF